MEEEKEEIEKTVRLDIVAAKRDLQNYQIKRSQLIETLTGINKKIDHLETELKQLSEIPAEIEDLSKD